MDFRITHGPAAPRNDLQFVKAGTLRITPQTVEFSGKWRLVTPTKPDIWTLLMPLLLVAAVTADDWLPAVWRTGHTKTILSIIQTLFYSAYAVFITLRSVPLSKKVTAGRDSLREITRRERELTLLFRAQHGYERCAVFNTDAEEEAAAIETALREGGTEQTFTITYGPATARPIIPVPGQLVIGTDHVCLIGRLPRDPYPDRRVMLPVMLVFMAAFGLIIALAIVLEFSFTSRFAGTSSIYFAFSFILFMVLFFVILVYVSRRMRTADVAKSAITEIRQQGQQVSFRAPLEGNHDVSGVTTILQAGSPQQAAAIAQALATPTAGTAPFTVNYGTERDINTFSLTGNGLLRVEPDVVRISGRRNAARLSIGAAGFWLYVLIFVPFLIAYAAAWLVVHDMMLALLISSPAFFIASIIVAWPHRVTIPRQDITDIERDGRQLTLRARIAGRDEQAVFHTRSEEEAGALALALE